MLAIYSILMMWCSIAHSVTYIFGVSTFYFVCCCHCPLGWCRGCACDRRELYIPRRRVGTARGPVLQSAHTLQN